MKIGSSNIVKQIITDIELMPDYHIELFGEKVYKKMLTPSNWKRKIITHENGYVRRLFVFEDKRFLYDIEAFTCDDEKKLYDIQYEYCIVENHRPKRIVF